jgi:hypothetical protein
MTDMTLLYPKRRCVNGFLLQDPPLSKVALGRAEQGFRVQEASTRIATILLGIVHLAGTAGIHALHNLLRRYSRLPLGNRGNFL